MKTRITNTLPNDFFPHEIEREIANNIPAQLFAQTSSFWRSYHYLRALKDAALMQLDDVQERILTNLLLNKTLFCKAQEYLPTWIHYLRSEYYPNDHLSTKNRLLAKALLLLVDKQADPKEWAEFEILLKAFCNSHMYGQKALYQSLQWLVTSGKSERPEFDLAEVADRNCINSVCEAQLILAPFLINDPSAFVMSMVDTVSKSRAFFSCSGRFVAENVELLIHAAVKSVPSSSEFWRRYQTTLPKLFGGMLELKRGHQDSLIDLITTLLRSIDVKIPWSTIGRHLGRVDASPIAEHYYSQCNENYKLALDDMVQAATQLRFFKNDKERIKWLSKVFLVGNYDHILFHFVPNVLAQLTSNWARKKVIALLLRSIDLYKRGSYNNPIVKLIYSLFVKLNSQTAKKVVTEALYKLFTKFYPFSISKASFIFNFLPEERYQASLEEQFLSLKCLEKGKPSFILLAFCEGVSSKEQIDKWLAKFQPLIDSLPTDLPMIVHHWTESPLCYTKLLAKKRDPKLVQQWQAKLQQLYKINHWWEMETAKLVTMIFPYLDQEAMTQWLAMLKKSLIPDGEEPVMFSRAVECLNHAFKFLSREQQIEYWSLVKEFLDSFTSRHLSESHLTALPNLLRQVPDDMLLTLTQPGMGLEM